MELKKLKELISQKDTELEHHKRTSVQPSQAVPAAEQQPCSNPAPSFNDLKHINEPNKEPTLKDLQSQQQKISVVVNYLCNVIRTQDMYWHNQPSFNPYL